MKKTFIKLESLALSVIFALSLSVSACAGYEPTQDAFTPTSTSTWGDAHRHLDPEGFFSLPEEIQAELDSVLLTEESPDTAVTDENGVTVVGTMAPMYASANDADDDSTTWVSAEGYLYEEPDSGESSTAAIDIVGFSSLILGTSSDSSSIDYYAALSVTRTCPYLYCAVLLYDAENNEFIGIDSSNEYNDSFCDIDDSFTGLKGNHSYTVKALGVITPPDGYYASGNLTRSTTQKTK